MGADSVFNMAEALERVDHDHETFQMRGEIVQDEMSKDVRDAQAAGVGSRHRTM